MLLNSPWLFPSLFIFTSLHGEFENLQQLLLPGVTADLNFTIKKGVSGLFRVHIVLRDDGRDELPSHISSQSLSDSLSISQFGRSEEKILVVQVDAENQPPTFITDGKLEVLQALVCFHRFEEEICQYISSFQTTFCSN
jgi:hypothetical protein